MPPDHLGDVAQKKRKRTAVEIADIVMQSDQESDSTCRVFHPNQRLAPNDFGVFDPRNRASLPSNVVGNSWDASVLIPQSEQFGQYQPASGTMRPCMNINNVLNDTVSPEHTMQPPSSHNTPSQHFVPRTSTYPSATTESPQMFAATPLAPQVPYPALERFAGYEPASELQLPRNSTHVAISPDEMVCFGVIGGIKGRCERPSSTKSLVEATIISPGCFLISDSKVQGHILANHSFLLGDIIGSELELRVGCSFEGNARGKRDTADERRLLQCRLDIAIYGPARMLTEIKEWSEHNEVYLQDPAFCFRDARYCNPQRLSLHFDTPCMVSQVSKQFSEHKMRLRDITGDEDFLDKHLASKTELQETEQPSAIKTALKSSSEYIDLNQSHQKQALTFMLRREMGWAFRGPEQDIWAIHDNANGRFYINAVSESGSKEQPPAFCGGVIADPMGLGKTLTMIALAATDLTRAIDCRDMTVAVASRDARSVSATLVVVPPPLLRVWENQMSEHAFDGALRFTRHHAKSRVTSMSALNSVDVVLTTYHTVSAEWSETGKSSSFLFSVQWKRIVLDEAHIIRNESSRMSRAMCSLDAQCRWAVTGTPIQNHLNDLAALLKFIRAHPYESRRQFEADISDYWKDGKAQEAAARLQRLSSCLFLRRPKSTIQLPPRYDKEYPIDFTSQERMEYDLIKAGATLAIDQALQQGHGSQRSGAYANILHQIESLRMFCGLGLHYHTRHDEGSIASHHALPWNSLAQKMFKLHLEMGSLQCSQCHATIDLTQAMFDDSSAGGSLFSQCLKFVCAECAAKLAKRRIAMPCGHTPSCPTSQVSTSIDAMDEADEVPMAALPTQMPSKIVALISDLKSQPADVKSVVFSTWRLTLNVVAAGLEQAGIQFLRFDGSIPQKSRQEIPERFKKDPVKRVLLLTFSCGAVGLTLTEASRAYLLEPHWNPTIEEQALGRVYRIGQDKEVTTVRFFVRDSFETHVMNVQQSKRNLARVILAAHDGGLADTTLENLQASGFHYPDGPLLTLAQKLRSLL